MNGLNRVGRVNRVFDEDSSHIFLDKRKVQTSAIKIKYRRKRRPTSGMVDKGEEGHVGKTGETGEEGASLSRLWLLWLLLFLEGLALPLPSIEIFFFFFKPKTL